jgi:hypothetical protein
MGSCVYIEAISAKDANAKE